MIGILDYGMGNLRSVRNAVYSLGHDVALVTTPQELAGVNALIVPGVGAYAKAMENLRERGFIPAIRAYVEAGKPLLGICLGMQILSTSGTEPVDAEGLNVIPGRVDKLPVQAPLRLPHVGWNNPTFVRKHPVFARVKPNADFYFVHSYHFTPDNKDDALATSVYGLEFTCVVGRKNVLGVQFHPEKSQESGLRLLDNFCNWDGQC